MDPLVDLTEVQERPGFDGIDTVQAEATLDDASALVRDLVKPALDAIDSTSPERPAAVVPVIVAMVRRGLSNPRGLTSESLGDWSGNMGDQGVATLYMTARERSIVRRAVGLPAVSTIQLEGDLPFQPGEPWVTDALL